MGAVKDALIGAQESAARAIADHDRIATGYADAGLVTECRCGATATATAEWQLRIEHAWHLADLLAAKGLLAVPHE